MSEWQPIETAPTDGTRCLLFEGGNAGVTFGYRWRDEMWIDIPGYNTEFFPSHWQPLPDPPTK